MNVSCPECRSVFRVDPSKLPAITVRARCSVCGGVITIAEGSSIEDEFASAAPAKSAVVSGSTRASSQVGSPPQSMESWRSKSSADVAAFANNADIAAVGVHTPSQLLADAAIEAPAALPPLPAPKARTEGAAVVTQASAGSTPSAAPPAKPAANRPVLFPPRPMIPGGPGGAANGPTRPAAPTPRPAMRTPAGSSPPAMAPRSLSQPPAPTASVPNATSQPIPIKPPTPQTGTGTPARAPINPFLANDPHAKAKRLARALVSDLVTYFPQKCEEGLRDGTLKQLFKDEIQKSYEEYVGQIGREFAETTPHFQDALNDILARGQKVF